MFGRHPRLAIDAYLGLNSEDQSISSRQHYATKLKKRLHFAYKVASREAEKSALRHETRYDAKVRESTLDIGDRVLVRNVCLKGKHKLAVKWERDAYIVIDIPDGNIPVFKVRKESGNHQVRVLHRNMLLPFSFIPSDSEFNDSLPSTKENPTQTQRKSGRKVPVENAWTVESSDM